MAKDSVRIFIFAGVIILLTLAVIIQKMEKGCLAFFIFLSIIYYSLFILILNGSNYKIVESPEGYKYVFQTYPFVEVTLFSGSRMEIIKVAVINSYSSGRRKEMVDKKVLKIIDQEGKITLSSLFYNSLGRKIYVDRADSLQIERRGYTDGSFKGLYDVIRVWKDDLSFRTDILGRNPDASGYNPLSYEDDVPEYWPE